MTYFEHRWNDEFFVIRRTKTGEDDGTPVFSTGRTNDDPYYGLYQEPLGKQSGRNTSGTGTAVMTRSTLFCSPDVDVTEDDQIEVRGDVWRIDSIIKPEGISVSGCEIEIHRAKNS